MEEIHEDVTEILETRHRKEKKELQAQIQALKKAAKNDKTKKKEILAEIAKLEFELDKRHKQELEAISKNEAVPDDNAEDLSSMVNKNLKISKAQKRREKKSQLEKQREDEIKLQEQENLHGPRNLEIQSISSKLKDLNLRMFLVPSDGDCLFKAIAHQLEIKKQVNFSVDELRKKVSLYMKQNKNDFIPFMSNPNTSEVLSEEEFSKYCDQIENTKIWGGQLEIKALSSLLKCPITVIQATSPYKIEQGSEFDGPALIITYHRYMYSLGEHYNSTCMLNDEVEDND